MIAERANATQPNMGLTTWKHAPKGKILKTDITIAKNYLSEKELGELNRIVSRLDAFLQFNEYTILKDAGRITSDIAKNLAEEQFEQFRVRQDRDYLSDFDDQVKQIEK